MVPDPSLTPDLIQARTFTSAFRGYDQSEVRDFLNRIAAEVRALRERADQLESAWRSAEERAARPPVLDEETLMAAVGEETAAILRTARAAAMELRNKAAEESERAIAEARDEADRMKADAETVLADERKAAEESVAGIIDAARIEADEILNKVRADAETVRAKAEQERALTIEGANSTRERILEDLGRRRRVATVQIEQLRAGRERLLEAYAVVRRTLEEAQEDLTRADAEARAAADDVGRRLQREQQDADLAELEGAGDHVEPATAAEPAVASGSVAQHEPLPSVEPDVPVEPDVATEPDVPVELDVATEPDVAVETVAGDDGLSDASAVEAGYAVEAPAAGMSTASRAVPASRQSPVEELFARIRAGKEDSGPAALDKVLTPQTTGASSGVAEAEPEESLRGAEDEESASHEESVPHDDEAEASSGDDDSDGDRDAWLELREARLVDLETGLTRKLKRALQDEQNDLLDRLRGLRGEPTPEALLPDLNSHTARYTRASMPVLEEAASAGGEFAAEALGSGSASASEGESTDVSDLADDAATVIVAPLRRRLEHLITSGASEEQSVLVESLGAAYREWKSHRIERVAGDVLAAAFSRGTWNASPEGTSFRWIVEDADGPCPDCDDDALAGELPKGEPFPTGQPYPPAHSGCRCLLVPVSS